MSNETTLDDVLALVAKATPGEWRIFIPDDYAGGYGFPGLGLEAESGTAVVWYADSPEQGIENDQDAEAIAAAVNYLRANGPSIKAALEDARRYRWIAAEAKRYKGDNSPKMLRVSITVPRESDGFLGIRHCPADLNAAIDAAQEVGRG